MFGFAAVLAVSLASAPTPSTSGSDAAAPPASQRGGSTENERAAERRARQEASKEMFDKCMPLQLLVYLTCLKTQAAMEKAEFQVPQTVCKVASDRSNKACFAGAWNEFHSAPDANTKTVVGAMLVSRFVQDACFLESANSTDPQYSTAQHKVTCFSMARKAGEQTVENMMAAREQEKRAAAPANAQ